MRILYGVVGEGMGHATRSKVVCEHLVESGHQVKIVVSGRAHAFLAKSFPDVVEIKGLTIRYVDNRMDRDGTLARNVIAAPGMLASNVSAYFAKVAKFKPEAVIADFDSFAYLFAKRHGLPVMSIDNQQIISRCKLGKFAKQGVKVDYQMTKAFVRAKLPACDHYVITTFFYPPIRPKYAHDTTLVPPILRKSILEAKKKARAGDHVLVYQTSTSDTALIDQLNGIGKAKFIVYGLRKNAVQGNCTQGLQRGGLHRRPRGRARCGGQRRTVAHRRGAVPGQAHLQPPGRQPVRAGLERALPRGARLGPRRRAHRGGRAAPVPRRGPQVRGARRQGPQAGRQQAAVRGRRQEPRALREEVQGAQRRGLMLDGAGARRAGSVAPPCARRHVGGRGDAAR